MGEAASDGSVSRGAISYSLGSNGGYALKEDNVIYKNIWRKKLAIIIIDNLFLKIYYIEENFKLFFFI